MLPAVTFTKFEPFAAYVTETPSPSLPEEGSLYLKQRTTAYVSDLQRQEGINVELLFFKPDEGADLQACTLVARELFSAQTSRPFTDKDSISYLEWARRWNIEDDIKFRALDFHRFGHDFLTNRRLRTSIPRQFSIVHSLTRMAEVYEDLFSVEGSSAAHRNELLFKLIRKHQDLREEGCALTMAESLGRMPGRMHCSVDETVHLVPTTNAIPELRPEQSTSPPDPRFPPSLPGSITIPFRKHRHSWKSSLAPKQSSEDPSRPRRLVTPFQRIRRAFHGSLLGKHPSSL